MKVESLSDDGSELRHDRVRRPGMLRGAQARDPCESKVGLGSTKAFLINEKLDSDVLEPVNITGLSNKLFW
jgi:hypothetical protein